MMVIHSLIDPKDTHALKVQPIPFLAAAARGITPPFSEPNEIFTASLCMVVFPDLL